MGTATTSKMIVTRRRAASTRSVPRRDWHPTQMLADMLTMRDHVRKPLAEVSYCYLGDGRNNTANSLLVTGALLGLDVRICAPDDLWPAPWVQGIARDLAASSGAR